MLCDYLGEEVANGQFDSSSCSFEVKEDPEGETSWFNCYDGKECEAEAP